MANKRQTGRPKDKQRHESSHRWSHGDPLFQQLVAMACGFLTEGNPPKLIQSLMQKRLKELRIDIEITREDPYRFIAYAASQKQLRFIPPSDFTLTEQLKAKYPILQSVKVVGSNAMDDIAYHGAAAVKDLLRIHYAVKSKSKVRIGFGGGYSSRRLSRALAELLQQVEDVPSTIVFHALAGGFDLDDVNAHADSTNPNSFWSYFVDNPGHRFESQFMGLSAPGLVTWEEAKYLRQLRGIKEVFDKREEVEIIVSSAGHWGEGHTQYMRYEKAAPKFNRALVAAECVGDVLWHPVTRKKMPGNPALVPMTLFTLDEVSERIRNNARVLLVIGPCGFCGESKNSILRAILDDGSRKLVTDLVVDARCALEILKG